MNNKEEFKLSIDELPILLNILYLRGNREYEVYPYFLKKTLYHISLKNQVQIYLKILRDEYYEIFEKKGLYDFPEIIPKYGAVRSSLIGSGFLKMNKWDNLKEKLDNIKSIEPLKGQRYTFIGLDTNCFMNRIYSVIKNNYINDIDNFYFVLSEIVLQELLSTQKISVDQLESLKQKFPSIEKIVSEFWNSDDLKSRKRLIGLIEFNKVRSHSKCLINEGIEIKRNVDNDLQILQDFKNQILPQHYDLLFISSDKQIVQQARGPGVPSFYLKLPALNQLPQEYSGNWNMLCEFIILNSIYFGALSLRGNQDTIQLSGLWRNKSISQWDSESIKIIIGSEEVSNLLQKQLAIIRNIP